MSPDRARTVVRTTNTVIAALAVHLGDADAICAASKAAIRGIWSISAISSAWRKMPTIIPRSAF